MAFGDKQASNLDFGGEDATLGSRLVNKTAQTDGGVGDRAETLRPHLLEYQCGRDAVQTAAERCESVLSLKFCIASFVIGSGENKKPYDNF